MSTTLTLGAIGGSGFGITKTGTGMLTLTGNNTYSGNTIVSAGTLKLAPSVASANTISASPIIRVDGTLDVSGLTGGTIALASTQTLQGTAQSRVELRRIQVQTLLRETVASNRSGFSAA